MEHSLIVEAEAADWYEFDRNVTTQRVGFITDDDHTMGCSPDRLVGDNGLLEIKALPHTQVEYWISGEVGERFWAQLQGQCSTFRSGAGGITSAGMTCFRRSSCGSSRKSNSSRPRSRIADLQLLYRARDGEDPRDERGARPTRAPGIEGGATGKSGNRAVNKQPNFAISLSGSAAYQKWVRQL